MRIIPAIDLMDGKCVRLSQGDYNRQRVYSEDPVSVAKGFEDAGIQHLHLVDLDGAKVGRTIHWKVLENIAKRTGLKIDFGGGLTAKSDIQRAFSAGAFQVVIGSLSVVQPERVKAWGAEFGFERIVLAADVRERLVATNGWMNSSQLQIGDYISQYIKVGFTYFLCTDIARDGMLMGPALDLYSEIIADHPSIKLVASGGVQNSADLAELQAIGLEAAVLGKAIYEGKITLNELVKLC